MKKTFTYYLPVVLACILIASISAQNSIVNGLEAVPMPVEKPIPREYSISGLVTDDNGEPLIGANICVPLTGIGTTTDLNGEFLLTIPESDGTARQILISFVGFQPAQFDITESTDVELSLRAGVSLDEIVIVDYASRQGCILSSGCFINVNSDIPEYNPLQHALQPENDNYKISTYPNPFINQLQVEFSPRTSGMYAFSLTDIAGRFIWSDIRYLNEDKTTVEINFSQKLINGTYTLKVSSGNVQRSTLVVRQGD